MDLSANSLTFGEVCVCTVDCVAATVDSVQIAFFTVYS